MAVKSSTAMACIEPGKEVPFTITMSSAPKAEKEMSKAEFNARMETGLAQIKNGETVPIDDVFANMHQRISQ